MVDFGLTGIIAGAIGLAGSADRRSQIAIRCRSYRVGRATAAAA
jgi:hypothetical protein